MKQIATLLIVSLVAFTQSFAQEFKVSIGGEASFHTGTYSELIGNAYGATIRAEIPLIDNVGIIITTSTMYSAKDYEIKGVRKNRTKSHTHLVPIMIGSKVNISKQLYVIGEAGMNSFLFISDDFYYESGSMKIWGTGEEYHESRFGWGVGIGLEIPLIEKLNLDINAKYQTVRDNYDHFNTRLGLSVVL